MQAKTKVKIIRAVTIICIGALITAIIGVLILNPTENEFYTCWYRENLHIKCLTCGGTRAVYYFFTFQIGKAFYYHAYFTALSPLIGYVIIGLGVNGVVGKRLVPMPKFRWFYPVLFVVGLVVFGVIRNFTGFIY